MRNKRRFLDSRKDIRILSRLAIVVWILLVVVSCNDSRKEVDPLFYRISEADSVRYMDEILEGFIDQAKEKQRREEELFSTIDFMPPPICFVRPSLSICINSKGELYSMYLDSLSVKETVIRYFSFNRDLSSAETAAASMDPESPSFDFPFFNRFGIEEIERRIEETTNEWKEIKSIEGVDSALVKYYEAKMDEWKIRKRVLMFLGADELPEIVSHARIEIEYRKESIKLEEVIREVSIAFYQLRNYECLRYFNVSYLSLYDRVKRKNKKKDIDKLEAIEILRPVEMHLIDLNKPSPYRQPLPVALP